MREGKASEAATLLRQATELNPQDEGGWRLLGAALGQSHDLAGSVSAFQRAVALVPGSAKNHYNLAVALQVAERDNEARQHLEKALALDPAYEQARLRLRDLAAKTAPAPMGKMAPSAPSPPTMSLTPVGGGGLQPIGGGLSPIGGGLAPMGGGTPEPPAPSGLQPVGGGAPAPSYDSSGYTPPSSLNNPAAPPTGSRDKPLDMHEGIRATGFDAYRGMQGDVDSAVRGWNWGAFLLSPFWLINHGMREIGWGWIIGSFILGSGFSTFHIPWASGIFNILQFGVSIFLGICGSSFSS